MYKKIVTISLSALLASSAFCGCSDSNSSSASDDEIECVKNPLALECQEPDNSTETEVTED